MSEITEDKKTNKPFFSVCLDMYNREDSIEKVLRSVCEQKFPDFEFLIVDNGSDDRSLEICHKILAKYPGIDAKIFKEDRKTNDITGWNSPILKASGKYIAICEGDDYYHRDHLSDAKNILDMYPNTTLYIAGSKVTKFKPYEVVDNHEYSVLLKTFQWCPPPSCTIFQRISSKGDPNFYNEQYVWAGEYDLYSRLLNSEGLVIVNNSKNYIDRGYRFYLKTDFHMKDAIMFYELNKRDLKPTEDLRARHQLTRMALHLFFFNLIFGKFNKTLIRTANFYSISIVDLTKTSLLVFSGTVKTAIKQRIKSILAH